MVVGAGWVGAPRWGSVYKDCTFVGHNGYKAIDHETGCDQIANYRVIGNRVFGFDYFIEEATLGAGDIGDLNGNIVYDINLGLWSGMYGDEWQYAYNNTFYGVQDANAGNGSMWRIITSLYNNVICNNSVGNGIDVDDGAAVLGYNNSYGNANNNYAGTYVTDGTNFSLDPNFVNTGANDFRLRADSPLYNKGKPNSGIRACPGAYTSSLPIINNWTIEINVLYFSCIHTPIITLE